VRELFVWYRVAAGRVAEAQDAVQAMQRALRHQRPGLAARLLVRRDETGDVETWMETYALAAPNGGVDALLERLIEDRARSLGPLLASPRHVEAFEPLDG
jgi:hypothetical protein